MIHVQLFCSRFHTDVYVLSVRTTEQAGIPLSIRIHASEPVPYLLYRSYAERQDGPALFTEQTAAATGITVPVGDTLIDRLIRD